MCVCVCVCACVCVCVCVRVCVCGCCPNLCKMTFELPGDSNVIARVLGGGSPGKVPEHPPYYVHIRAIENSTLVIGCGDVCVTFVFVRWKHRSSGVSMVERLKMSKRGYMVAAQYLLVDKEPELICTSCTGIIRDPVQSLCGHRYCKGCLEEIIRLVLS